MSAHDILPLLILAQFLNVLNRPSVSYGEAEQCIIALLRSERLVVAEKLNDILIGLPATI